MKTSVTSYSFGEYINPDRLGYLGIIDKAKEFGFDGIEYTEGYWMDDPDAPLKIKEHCEEVGIEPALFAVGADFINGSGGDQKAEIARVCKLVDIAAAMGMKKMRHDVTGGFRGKKYSIGYDDALKIIADPIREVSKYAEQKGVMTCTEKDRKSTRLNSSHSDRSRMPSSA